MIEPSGVTFQYFGCAAGKGRQPCKTEMEKLALTKPIASENIDVKEGVRHLARMIYLTHDDSKDKPFQLEMSWICEESAWEHKGVPINTIKEAVQWAQKDIAESEAAATDEVDGTAGTGEAEVVDAKVDTDGTDAGIGGEEKMEE